MCLCLMRFGYYNGATVWIGYFLYGAQLVYSECSDYGLMVFFYFMSRVPSERNTRRIRNVSTLFARQFISIITRIIAPLANAYFSRADQSICYVGGCRLPA
jgi:hypothetical protein